MHYFYLKIELYFMDCFFFFVQISYFIFAPSFMKQISLMDSFSLKKKDKGEASSEVTPIKPTQTRTAQKMVPESWLQENQNNNEPINNFKELIQGGDFSYEKIVIEKPRKRKMEIDDDQPPKNENGFQGGVDDQSEEEQEKNKTGRKLGSTAKSSYKKYQQDKNKKQNMIVRPPANPDEEPSQLLQKIPDWASPQGCRDSLGRRPGHPDYDPTTLYIPPDVVKGFTQTMKQYWRIKSENYDKVVLFKMGKFYQLFYEDALIANKHMDLRWMGNKMHVGFPEKCLQKYIYEFVQLKVRVVVVQQLQTPDQMKERIGRDRVSGKKAQRTLMRGVTKIVTRGTIVNFIDENQYLPNYLIAVSKHNNQIGYSLLQMGNNLIMVGIVDGLQDFKTVLFQTRPVQLLYDPDNLSLEIVDMMKQNWLNMVLSKLTNRQNAWHPMNAKNQIQNQVNSEVFAMPAVIQAMQKMPVDSQKLILSTLSGMFKYLKSLLKFEYIMSAVRFAFYQSQGSSQSMVLDSQALQHLEIFQTPLGQKDSLFEKIDRTRTKFGKRLFRRWVMQPLLDPYKINQRLDAIEDLENVRIDRDRLADVFGRLPDLQRSVNRLYHYSVKAIAEKAVYFEDVSSVRLRQFRELIGHLNKSWYALQYLRKHKNQFKSKRLVRLLTLVKKQGEKSEEDDDDNTEEGLLPLVRENLAQFEEYIKWEGDIPQPQKGLVDSYDMLQDELQKIKQKLENCIDQMRQRTGIPILKFVHTKQRYEIEFPEELEKKRPEESIFVSKKVGYSRYVTPISRKLVVDLEYVESQIKEQMGLFVGYFFQEFRKNQKIWEKYVAVLAQLDCLIGISTFSMQNGGVRPKFVEQGFNIGEAKHPCLKQSDVIANDINLKERIMLLTGPNMGGKSTLLRTTCLMVILAQNGFYVPAENYECQIIDRIFTRIGASDKLQEGKSTFFIEMEQTKSILSHGTRSSLAIIDELGRGTSTFDGMAIAYSVLLDLIERVQCRCLFATHYHSLSKQFQGMSEVQLKMMDYMVANQKIVFLYKLKDGRAEQSFGLNVAKVVKIPDRILGIAKINAEKMEEEIREKDKYKKVKQALALALN